MPRIAAPRPPDPPPPFRFPVIATIAPVVAAGVLWAVTRSPLTLAFAALGPVIAVAGFADSRLGARRTMRRAAAAFAAGLETARAAIERAHDAERAALDEAHPAATALLHDRIADPGRWSGLTRIVLGRAGLPSTVELDAPHAAHEPAQADLDALAGLAATLPDAPVLADATGGIGISGPAPIATAVARALGVQLAWRLPPDRWSCGERGQPWARHLPHRPGPAPRHDGLRFDADDGAELVLAVSEREDALPAGCGTILVIEPEGVRVTWHPDPAVRGALEVEAVAEPEAARWAIRLAEQAARAGLAGAGSGPPERAELSGLLDWRQGRGGALESVFVVGADGPLTVDLVAHGPHAVIGGTTGSGKSELLIAWVLALAAAYPPSAVAFLLVDFKGGSAFAPLARLPHTAGIITDLDAAGALRALTSLRAEVRHRERTLASEGVRDVDETDRLGRLVIVVDEFAAMLGEHPDLHALFTDLAARGRSLGIHLVLCTQRPAGAVRDGVLANTDLRISLRVNNRADSTAVIGSEFAAAIPAGAKGRAFVSLAGAEPVAVQVARAGADVAPQIAARWAGSAPARRPWLEPLPPVVPLATLDRSDDGHVFGLLDRPDRQAREPAVWAPGRHGGLLVLGCAGSGTSTAIATLARLSGARWLPTSVEAAWDVLAELLDAPDAGVVVMDDLDALAARYPPEYRTEFADRLTRLAREGPAAGLHIAAAMRRVPGELQGFASLLPARLLLRHASRHDLLLAGGDGALHDPDLPPGGGSWSGARVQVALSEQHRPPDPPAALEQLDPARPLAVVTTRPAAIEQRLVRAGHRVLGLEYQDDVSAGAAIVGDVDDWQSRWGLLPAVRAVASVVFDACTPSDLRQLARIRPLPPPLRAEQAWLLRDDGGVGRTRLPG